MATGGKKQRFEGVSSNAIIIRDQVVGAAVKARKLTAWLGARAGAVFATGAAAQEVLHLFG